MHSIVLLTAMTATTGLFGGHRQARTAGCAGGQCARPAAVAHTPPMYAPASGCSTGQCAPAPRAYAPAPAHATYAQAPAMTYRSAYYPPASNAPSSCATGNCSGR